MLFSQLGPRVTCLTRSGRRRRCHERSNRKIMASATVTTDALTTALPHAWRLQMPNTGALIGNKWVAANETFKTYCPSTESELATVTCSRRAEVDAAVAAAHEAFYNPKSEFNLLSGAGRGILLYKLADLIEQNVEELAKLESLDNGKPYWESSQLDVPFAAKVCRYYAGWADKISGSVVTPNQSRFEHKFATVEKEPVGVCGQVIPWNFPILMLVWKIAPAIACGCTVVVKTAPQTPLSANRIGELLLEAGFPPGAVNILPGDDETGKLLVQHELLDKIAFTGSTAVGKEIGSLAMKSEKIKRVTLELGGKSPLIVLKDADVEMAAEIAFMGLFANMGQCCCASSRILVHENVYSQFVDSVAAKASAKPMVAPWEEAAARPSPWPQGPQVDKAQMENIMRYIDTGIAEGATLVTGGKKKGGTGHFVEPTVFSDVADNATVCREEIFGPVLCVGQFKETEEAIKRANNSIYGLAASVISPDIQEARNVARRLRAGSVWINCYNSFDAALPFGGFKASGIGRELGEAGLSTYLETKTVVVA